MHDYILGWRPAIVFLVCLYFHRRGLRRLRLSIKADRHEVRSSFKSIEEKLDAIHAEMIRNLRLYGMDTKGLDDYSPFNMSGPLLHSSHSGVTCHPTSDAKQRAFSFGAERLDRAEADGYILV
jgi:hypothetical protein